MKIAKEFNWDMGHRLPEHFGKCKNVHGHSYKMIIELDGTLNDKSMVMDYYDLKKLVLPIIENLDHAFMVYIEDKEMISALEKLNSKKIVVDFESTVENICNYILNEIKKYDFPSNVKSIKIRIHETPNDYAEESVVLRD